MNRRALFFGAGAVAFGAAVPVSKLLAAIPAAPAALSLPVPFSVRDEALAGLRGWWAERMDQTFLAIATDVERAA